MLYIPNSLIVNKLSYFSLCFFTKFASNALKRPVNRHGFAAKASKKAEKRTLLVPFDSNRKPLKISLKYQTWFLLQNFNENLKNTDWWVFDKLARTRIYSLFRKFLIIAYNLCRSWRKKNVKYTLFLMNDER